MRIAIYLALLTTLAFCAASAQPQLTHNERENDLDKRWDSRIRLAKRANNAWDTRIRLAKKDWDTRIRLAKKWDNRIRLAKKYMDWDKRIRLAKKDWDTRIRLAKKDETEFADYRQEEEEDPEELLHPEDKRTKYIRLL